MFILKIIQYSNYDKVITCKIMSNFVKLVLLMQQQITSNIKD